MLARAYTASISTQFPLPCIPLDMDVCAAVFLAEKMVTQLPSGYPALVRTMKPVHRATVVRLCCYLDFMKRDIAKRVGIRGREE